jgi:hypothetical protein
VAANWLTGTLSASTRQALAGVKPAELAEGRPLLLRQRTTQDVRSLLRDWTTREAGKR